MSTATNTYPDIVIVCDEPQFEDAEFDTLLNPRVVVEVLSDSTERYDRGTKFAHYRQIPSVREYVFVAQDQPLVERYVRQDEGTWVLSVFNQLEQTFANSRMIDSAKNQVKYRLLEANPKAVSNRKAESTEAPGNGAIPLLENGDRLTRADFER